MQTEIMGENYVKLMARIRELFRGMEPEKTVRGDAKLAGSSRQNTA